MPDSESQRKSQGWSRRFRLRLLRLRRLALYAWLGLGLFTVLAAVFLSLSSTKKAILDYALDYVNSSIQGEISIGDAEIRWLSGLRLEDISLLAPDGQPVVEAKEATLDYSLLELLRFKLAVDRLELLEPEATLATDLQGQSNLDAALASTSPEPANAPEAAPWDGTLPLDVELKTIALRRAAFTMTDERNNPAIQADIEALELEANYAYRDAIHQLKLDKLETDLQTPRVGHVAVKTEAEYSQQEGRASLLLDNMEATATGFRVAGKASLHDLEALSGDLALDAELSPEFLALFSSDELLDEALKLNLEAKGSPQALEVDARLEATDGSATLAGTLASKDLNFDSESLEYDLLLTTHALDLDKVLGKDLAELPELSPLTAGLKAKGKGLSPDTMDSALELRLEATSWDTYSIDSAAVKGRLRQNRLTVRDARIESPYGGLSARGLVNLEGALDLNGQFATQDLEAVAQMLELPIHGDIQVDLTVKGAMGSPVVDFLANSKGLAYRTPDYDVELEEVEAKGSIQTPDDTRDFLLVELDSEIDALELNLAERDEGQGDSEATLSSNREREPDPGLPGQDGLSEASSTLSSNRESEPDPGLPGEQGQAQRLVFSNIRLSMTYDETRVVAQLTGDDSAGKAIHFDGESTLAEPYRIAVRQLKLPLGGNDWTAQRAFSITVDGDEIALSQAVFAGAGGEIEATGYYSSTGKNDLSLACRDIHLASFGPLLPESLEGLSGQFDLTTHLFGPADNADLEARLEFRELRSKSIPELGGALKLATKGSTKEAADSGETHAGSTGEDASTQKVSVGRRLALNGEVDFRTGGKVLLGIHVPARVITTGAPEFLPEREMGGFLHISALNLALLEKLQEPGSTSFNGTLDGFGSFSGSSSRPAFSLHARSTNVRMLSVQPLEAELTMQMAGTKLETDGKLFNPRAGDAPLASFSASVPLEVNPDFDIKPAWSEAAQAHFRIEARELKDFSPLHPPLERVKGRIALELDLDGLLSNPSIRGRIRGRQLQMEASPDTDIDLETTYAEGRAALLLRSQFAGEPAVLAEARVDLPLDKAIRGEDFPLSDLRAALDIPRLDLKRLPSDIRGPNLRSGVLSLKGLLESPGPEPVFSLQGGIHGLSAMPGKSSNLILSGSFRDRKLTLAARVSSEDSTQAKVNGDIPLELNLPLSGADFSWNALPGMGLKAILSNFDISLANAFMPGQTSLEGILRGRLDVTGSLDSPKLEGKAWLARGQLFMPSYGVYYDWIRGKAEFSPEKISLSHAAASGGDGEARLQGSLSLSEGSPKQLEGKATFKKFLALDGPYGKAVINGALTLSGTMEAPLLRGDITLPTGAVKLPNFASGMVKEMAGLEQAKSLAPQTLPPNILVLTMEGPIPWEEYLTGGAGETEEDSLVDTDISIHMPRNMWIENDSHEVVIEVKGDLDYQDNASGERLIGEVETVRGELRIFSSPLMIQEGSIVFTGGQEIDPRLNFTATADVGDYGTVTATISGLLSEPEIALSSDQGYDYADVLSLLIIGRPLSESSDPGESDKIVSYMEQLAAGALSGWAQQQLANRLPIDRLEIRATSFSSADLRVGKYITPRLFIVYRRWIGEMPEQESNTNEARVEYQISKEVYLESFYGDAGLWGGQVSWKRMY